MVIATYSHHCRTAEDVNYYGTKRMLQVLKPLLKPKSRSVGISSSAGQLGAGSWHAGRYKKSMQCIAMYICVLYLLFDLSINSYCATLGRRVLAWSCMHPGPQRVVLYRMRSFMVTLLSCGHVQLGTCQVLGQVLGGTGFCRRVSQFQPGWVAGSLGFHIPKMIRRDDYGWHLMELHNISDQMIGMQPVLECRQCCHKGLSNSQSLSARLQGWQVQ